MSDILEKIGDSIIQHGKVNDRVYLIKLDFQDIEHIHIRLNKLANDMDYSKIIAKVPDWAKESFDAQGYKTEAMIPGFYEGHSAVYFMAYYRYATREKLPDAARIEDCIAFTKTVKPVKPDLQLDEAYQCRLLSPDDTFVMADVYKKVFQTYPFPIHDPSYLSATMKENIVYFGIYEGERLIAISSCEMDVASKNVEMTDFATLPEYRGKGLASYLLAEMEKEMRIRGILTAYTIARSVSFGMNISFAKHRYVYTGTLINNTNIAGGIESMNVWYKVL